MEVEDIENRLEQPKSKINVSSQHLKTPIPSHHSQADIMESNQDDDDVNDGGRTTMGQTTLKRNLINDVGLV